MRKWNKTLDVKDAWVKSRDGEITVAELIVEVMKSVHKLNIKDDWLTDIMLEFEEILDIGDPETPEFDYVLDKLYDWADNSGVWIKTVF